MNSEPDVYGRVTKLIDEIVERKINEGIEPGYANAYALGVIETKLAIVLTRVKTLSPELFEELTFILE